MKMGIVVFLFVLGFLGLFLYTSWNDPTNVQIRQQLNEMIKK